MVVGGKLKAMRRWTQPIRSIRRPALSSKRCFTASRAILERANIAELLAKDEEAEDVDVYGWVRSLRKQKKIAFAAVGDGSTLDSLQAVLEPEHAAQYVISIYLPSLQR